MAVLVLLAGTSGSAVAAPSCFGAAARDLALPCVNPSLRLKVTPQPRNAPLVKGAPCTKLPPEGVVVPCEFGVLAANARAHFALVGDSHAAHWRPTLAEMARGLQWHGYQLSRNSCSLTTVPLAQPEPYFSQCARLEDPGGRMARPPPRGDDGVPRRRRRRARATSRRTRSRRSRRRSRATSPPGRWLPASVTRVFVIRDNPSARVSTMDCVRRAVARRRAPGPACAVPRANALPPDPQEAAIAQVDPARFKFVDLTPFFCDERSCYPVVGGVLVHKDINHLTRHFAETLGPYLLRAVVGS